MLPLDAEALRVVLRRQTAMRSSSHRQGLLKAVALQEARTRTRLLGEQQRDALHFADFFHSRCWVRCLPQVDL
jgi:hypothetical protein